MEENNQPLLEIKPKFNFICTFLDKHFLTTVALLVLLSITFNAELVKIYILIGTLYFAYILIHTLINYDKCKNASYLFYEDRILLMENVKKGKGQEILYQNIKEFLLYQTTTQKIFKRGELIIKLQNDSILSKGQIMHELAEIEKTIQSIKKLIYEN